jgi:hypothetical protein
MVSDVEDVAGPRVRVLAPANGTAAARFAATMAISGGMPAAHSMPPFQLSMTAEDISRARALFDMYASGADVISSDVIFAALARTGIQGLSVREENCASFACSLCRQTAGLVWAFLCRVGVGCTLTWSSWLESYSLYRCVLDTSSHAYLVLIIEQVVFVGSCRGLCSSFCADSVQPIRRAQCFPVRRGERERGAN